MEMQGLVVQGSEVVGAALELAAPWVQGLAEGDSAAARVRGLVAQGLVVQGSVVVGALGPAADWVQGLAEGDSAAAAGALGPVVEGADSAHATGGLEPAVKGGSAVVGSMGLAAAWV